MSARGRAIGEEFAETEAQTEATNAALAENARAVKVALNTKTANRKRGHDLFLVGHVNSLPRLYSTEATKTPDKECRLKLFGGGRWAWYAFEADAELSDGTTTALADADPEAIEDVLFFGYVVSGLGKDCDELAYFRLSELAELEFPPFGLPVERDMHFECKPLGAELVKRWGYTEADHEVSGR
jgi:hypothetical protein